MMAADGDKQTGIPDQLAWSDNRLKVVLAVDDQPENLALIESAVTTAGYMFFGVKDGQECLSIVMRLVPKVILLDIQMPGWDGFETCKRLRADQRLARVPIIFLTASKSVADVRKGMAAGGNDFIIKPFDVDQLQARLRHWTTKRVSAYR
jgi:CheY-like chemotaxis protein